LGWVLLTQRLLNSGAAPAVLLQTSAFGFGLPEDGLIGSLPRA
jgi:hypothetical protein